MIPVQELLDSLPAVLSNPVGQSDIPLAFILAIIVIFMALAVTKK